jgi:hypothetical protein
MARPQVADGEDSRQLWRVAGNILNKQSWRAYKGWFNLGLGEGLTTPHLKENKLVMKPLNCLLTKRTLGRSKRRWLDNIKMEIGMSGRYWILGRIGTTGELL